MGRNNSEKLRELRHKIRLCELYKEKIHAKSEELFGHFIKGNISAQQYKNLIKRELDDRSLDQWTLIYDTKIAKLHAEMHRISETGTGTPFTIYAMAFVMASMLFTGIFYFNSGVSDITGLEVKENSPEPSDSANTTLEKGMPETQPDFQEERIT